MLERSRNSRPLNDSKDGGTIPWKRFLLMAIYSNFTQLPRLVGILLDNMFLEISICSRFLNFLISVGRTPVNWLIDKSKPTSENERPMTCEDIEPMRLLLERFKANKFWHLLRLRGMLPSRLFCLNTTLSK